MPKHENVIVGPVRLLWQDGSTAALIDEEEDLLTIPPGVAFAPTQETDEEGRQIFREYVGTIH